MCPHPRPQEFKDSIASVAQQLDQMAPNLKAMEQYEAVKRQEREHNELLDKAKEEARVREGGVGMGTSPCKVQVLHLLLTKLGKECSDRDDGATSLKCLA